MVTTSLLLSSSAKKFAPSTIVPVLHNPPHARLAPPRRRLTHATTPLQDDSSTSRAISETLSSIGSMGFVTLPPPQAQTKPRKSKRTSEPPLPPSEPPVEVNLEPSPGALESAMAKMTPRQREAFGLVISTKLSAEEIGARMRDEKPLHTVTVVNYLLSAFDIADYTWEEEEALYHAVGKDRLYEIAQADHYRWKKSNGYHAYVTNETRVKKIVQDDTKRRKLKKQLANGKVKPEELALKMQEISQGWTFANGPPEIPNGIRKHLIMQHLKKTKKHEESPGFFVRNQDIRDVMQAVLAEAALRSMPKDSD
ncbi:unnamed protein product [Somion occarium]|uniref:Uncharacterized protein n=1 Tax=Somion occarium TaxID=3059160 RepID=A0ABP1DZJ0_9APHY